MRLFVVLLCCLKISQARCRRGHCFLCVAIHVGLVRGLNTGCVIVGLLNLDGVRSMVRVDGEAELGGDDDPVADRCQDFAEQGFVREEAVGFGRVEQGDAWSWAARNSRIISCRSAAAP